MIKLKHPPYEDTTIPAEKTQMEIQQMLYEFGVEGVQWTQMQGKLPELAFVMEVEIQGARKKIAIHILPVMILNKKGRKYREEYVPNPNQSMRLLYWWLKSKMEATAYGLIPFEQEFLSKIIFRLPEGGTANVGDTITVQLLKEETPKLTAFTQDIKRITAGEGGEKK